MTKACNVEKVWPDVCSCNMFFRKL